MQAPSKNEGGLSGGETPETRRAMVVELRGQIAALQKQYSKEADAQAKQLLQVEMAGLQRRLQKLLDEMGVAGVPTKKGRPMTEAQVAMHLPTTEMTPSMIADLAAAGLATPEGAAAMAAVAAVVTDRPLVVPWQVPPMPKAPDVPSIAAWFATCKSLKAVQPIQRCEKDPHYKKGGGLANFCTNKPMTTLVGQDSEWISLLQQMQGPLSSEVYAALRSAVASHFVGSGPLDGWFARIHLGDGIRRPQFTLFPHEEELVLAQLPSDHARVVALKDLTLKEALDTIKVNPAADAGFPRQKKKGMCMPELIADAAQYFELLASKGFNQYVKQNPGEFVSVCKNKLDRYEMSDLGKKVRPYFNSNGGLSMLFSVVMQNYSRALLGFWEDRASCNAHGFAWNAGGGQRIYEWLLWCRTQKPGVYAICYSDDGIWVLVTSDGKLFVCDKDIAQCDMSVSGSHYPTMLKHFREVVRDKYGPGWQQVAVRALTNIWNQLVVLYGSLVYLSTDKVHSGGVGTAEADQIGASTMLALIRGAYDKARGTPFERFAEAEEEVSKRIGLRFKASPTGWEEFLPDQPEYHFKFLGKRLVKIGKQYYPHVDLDKCVVQLVTPKRNMTGTMGQRSWMERARGLGVTSLWTHPELYEYVKTCYDRKLVMGTTPASTFEGAETGERDLDQVLGVGVEVTWTCGDKFPDRNWVKALYSAPGTVVGGNRTGEAPKQLLVQVATPTVGDMLDQLFPEQEAHLWADRDDRALEVRDQARGKLGDGQRIAPIPSTPVNPGPQQYSIAPLPQAVKDAFNEARRRARALLKMAQGGSKAYTRKGSRVARLEAGDYREVVFTKAGIIHAYEEAAHEEIEYFESGIDEEEYYREVQEFGDEVDDNYWDRAHVRYARNPDEEPWIGDADEGQEAR